MKAYPLLLLALLPYTTMTAQDAAIQNNPPAATFLQLSTDARSLGMGGTGTAVANGNTAIFHNLSSAAFAMESFGVHYSYTPATRHLQKDVLLNTVSGFCKLGRNQGLAIGYRHFGYPKTEITDEEANLIGTSHPKEWALEAGYFTEISTNLSVGATLRYIQSNMGAATGLGKGKAYCFDLSATYRRMLSSIDEEAYWMAGVQLSSIGTKMKYDEDVKSSLPRKFSAGGSINLPFNAYQSELLCTADVSYLFPTGMHCTEAGFGAEYTFMRYALLCGGYHLGDKEKGMGNYGTVGCGAQLPFAQCNFAYVLAGKESPLKNSWQISLSIGL